MEQNIAYKSLENSGSCISLATTEVTTSRMPVPGARRAVARWVGSMPRAVPSVESAREKRQVRGGLVEGWQRI